MKVIKKQVNTYKCENCGEISEHSDWIFACDICGKEICDYCYNSFLGDDLEGSIWNTTDVSKKPVLQYNYCEDCAELVATEVCKVMEKLKKKRYNPNNKQIAKK